jgi:hypothetical protein
MSAVVSGLIGAVAALALGALAERTQRSAKRLLDGWHALRPSWLVHGCMVLCIGFVGLISYFLLRGGSSRPDATTQNLVASLLLAGAAWGAIYVGWTSYFRTIMWKGNELRVRTIIGREIVQRFSDVTKVTSRDMRGEYCVTFRDGSRLCFSEYMHGAKDLTVRLPKRAFSD